MTEVEISAAFLLHNLKQFQQKLGVKTKIMVVVKANAYGHGLIKIAKIIAQKIDWLGVNSLEEGLRLRQAKIKKPILILGYIPLKDLDKAAKNNLSFVVYNLETLRRIKAKAKIHLKIETGTNRQGIKIEELPDFLKILKNNKNIFLEGVYSHFADIENSDNLAFAKKQQQQFCQALMVLAKAGYKAPLRHLACTAAILTLKESWFDLVRLGIGLYGLWSIPPRRDFSLKPVLTWKTKVCQVKTVAKGETIGYGRTYKTNRKMKIAVLPVGYWDGYDRKLSNGGEVLIHGQKAPVVGRICMNMCMVDVTRIPRVKIEDEVILIGRQGKNEITADDLAARIDTINYEVVTRINPLIPRKVLPSYLKITAT